MLSQKFADATSDMSEDVNNSNGSSLHEKEEIYTAFIQQKSIIQ